MSEAASFSVDDREDTPVSHTFTPNGFDRNNPLAFFKNAGGTIVEDEKFSISWRETQSNRIVRCVLAIPTVVTETINGVDRETLERTARADVTFTFALSSTEDERDNVVGLLTNMLASANSVINDTVVGTEALW